MKIQNITNLYSPFKLNRQKNNSVNNFSNPFINSKQVGDIVSFRAKAYNSESVENPTNHCAYCGCKVYNDSQIESLAKEMLRDSSHRLQGDIKSVIEKLETAERSYELTVAKQIENKKEIEFYKKFLEQAEDKAWLKGDAIFQQVYDMNPDDAFDVLKKNMRPLLRTIDHVSPQNLGEENKDQDVNLVESCYCCNHDLKKGMSFSEFYTMYPSIKENMPVEKFKYAHAQLLASSSDSILQRVSASNLMKYVSGLFEQRKRAVSQLNNVDFRISESVNSITHSIQTCNEEIDEKEAQIFDLKSRLNSISDDEEYKAMLERIKFSSQKENIESELTILRDKRKNVSEASNELQNPSRKSKKLPKAKMSDDQKAQKIASYKIQLADINQQIRDKEAELQLNAEMLALLDEEFPTVDILQSRKTSYEAVVSAYSQLADEQKKLDDLSRISSLQAFDIQELDKQIESFDSDNFDPSKFSLEEQKMYAQYTSLLDALKYIEQHSNNNGVKGVVNRSAKVQIQKELEEFAPLPIVIASVNHNQKKELIAQRDKTKDEKAQNDKSISQSQNKISAYKRTTSKCSLEEAKEQSQKISVWISRLNEKQNYIQIPKIIEKLEAEIIMLRSVISDLTSKLEQINKLDIKEA